MPEIKVLSQETINKIAAGEVIERPMSVVKELVENAIDAGANAITVEIEDGGTTLIRVTDNGCGIARDEVETAFLSHATSKIRTAEDLARVDSLGFRGEALPSIAAVAEVELITKQKGALLGTRYLISDSGKGSLTEIGAPDGSTFLVRSLFHHTPARRKFLKTEKTEAGYCSALLERIALSHPDIAFQFISNGQVRLHTAGNASEKDLIYHLYGKEVASSLIPVEAENEHLRIEGYIGKPEVTRGNRNYENVFVNGRYVKSNVLSRGIEDAYRTYLMQHQYPFTVLSFTLDGEEVDVNVHPQKTELRFREAEGVYEFVRKTLAEKLSEKELIPEVPIAPQKAKENQAASPEQKIKAAPEPFEEKRLRELRAYVRESSPYEQKYEYRTEKRETALKQEERIEQQTLPFFSEKAKPEYRILGQAFRTYWIIEMGEKLYLIDQHAAHEKVIFERLMKRRREQQHPRQQISPPVVLTLSLSEETTLKTYLSDLEELGYEISSFGGNEYAITAMPSDILGLDEKQFFVEMLDDLTENGRLRDTETLYMKIATMSCKAAIKGGDAISEAEFRSLLDEMLTLDNPYNCPHGRPTTISMTRYELEKKFKRIVS